MNGFVGVTDEKWFRFLAGQPGIEEVNFWQPSAGKGFKCLREGEPFLFKLKVPHNAIAGGGFFAHYSRLPVDIAWQTFGLANGADSLDRMRNLIARYRNEDSRGDFEIGCILVVQPFFLAPEDWVPQPADWPKNVTQGKTYDLAASPGRELWEQVLMRLRARRIRDAQAAGAFRQYPLPVAENTARFDPDSERFGAEQTYRPRLGQGTFRVVVADAYQRRCAVTGERTFPVLEAAHIKPYAKEGEHAVTNGLLLRSDVHALFDLGYVTVSNDLNLEVSKKIRERFENGRDYYALHGRPIRLPERPRDRPDPKLLEWHASNVYLG